MASTAWRLPTATGSNYNSWTNPTNAFTDFDGTVTSPDAGVYQDYTSFNISIPAGATITGVQVMTRGAGSVSPAPQCGIELSGNIGFSYTASGKATSHVGGTYTYSTVGSSSDLWGRTWAPNDFSNVNFSVRLENKVATFSIDSVQVRVHYTLPNTAAFLQFF